MHEINLVVSYSFLNLILYKYDDFNIHVQRKTYIAKLNHQEKQSLKGKSYFDNLICCI